MAGNIKNFKGKQAAPFGKGGKRQKKSRKMAVGTMKKKEAALEAKGGPKTAAEKRLEASISKKTGKKYVGKR